MARILINKHNPVLPPFSSIQIETPQWNLIRWGFQSKLCILVLGPYFHKDSQGKPLRQLLANTLSNELNDLASFNPNDLPFVSKLYEKKYGNILLKMKAQSFYSGFNTPSDLACDLTNLPFHLIINTSPDHLLQAAFRREGGNCLEGTYLLGEQQSDVFSDDGTQPYVYNLFGSVQKLNSLVLTQDHQMAFVRSVIQRESALPDSLAKQLTKDKIYIFLGFDYDNWYLRFLLNLLNLDDKMEMVFGLHNGHNDPSIGSRIFFASQYGVSFVEMEDADFIKTAKEQLQGNGTAPKARPTKNLFCLCDAEDEPLLRELEKQLSSLKSEWNLQINSNLSVWAGEITEEAISQQISNADLMLPIITSDLIASDLYPKWMPKILDRRSKNAIIAPLLFRPCVWEGAEWAKLPSILPRKQQPVSRWNSKEEAYKHIVLEIGNMLASQQKTEN